MSWNEDQAAYWEEHADWADQMGRSTMDSALRAEAAGKTESAEHLRTAAGLFLRMYLDATEWAEDHRSRAAAE